jgi:HEAT repeat protein
MKKDQNDFVRKVATEVLAGCADPEAKTRLKALMAKSDQIAEQAFMASRLAEGGDPSGYPVAARLARSSKAYQRVQSTAPLYAFFRYRAEQLPITPAQPGPDELLRGLLDDTDADVRRVAVDLTNQIMQYRSPDDYVPLLEKMEKSDPDPAVRERCRLYLTSWPKAR